MIEDDNGAARSRVPLMQLAGLMIEDHPLLGVGANNFPVAMESYLTRGFSGEFLYTVHNKYLLVWTETGIVGLIAFLWFFVVVMRQGIRCWRCQDPVLSPLALGLTAALGGFIFHMFVEVFRGGPILQAVVVIAGLLAVCERLNGDRHTSAGLKGAQARDSSAPGH